MRTAVSNFSGMMNQNSGSGDGEMGRGREGDLNSFKFLVISFKLNQRFLTQNLKLKI
jgi:hypothetical protein